MLGSPKFPPLGYRNPRDATRHARAIVSSLAWLWKRALETRFGSGNALGFGSMHLPERRPESPKEAVVKRKRQKGA